MSQTQAAINAAATRSLAGRLERSGYTGDAIAEAEAIVAVLLAEGLAPIRRPDAVPPRGSGGSRAARDAALQATAAAVAEARAKRTGGHDPEPMATPRQLTKLAVALANDGTRERQDRLDWCGAMVGRDLGSTSELTRQEAHRLIEALEAPEIVDAEIVEDQLAYDPAALVDDADAIEAAVLAARDQADNNGTEEESEGGDAAEAEYRADQDTWAVDDEPASYAYAGGLPDEPPF